MNSGNEQITLLTSSITEIIAFIKASNSGSVIPSAAVQELVRECDLRKEVVTEKY